MGQDARHRFGTWSFERRDLRERRRRRPSRPDIATSTPPPAIANEDRVGEGIRAAGVPRDDIFITTKVRPEDLEEKAFLASVERSLKLIGVDQLDLVLIHWPSKTIPAADTIATLNAVKKNGWTRHIGVSNFTVKLLAEAWAATDAPLVTNQCEYHPYLNQDKLRAACLERDMIFTAFSPLGRRVVLEDPVIVAIAENASSAPRRRSCCAGAFSRRTQSPSRRAAIREHIRSNFEIFDFSLDDAEMAAIIRSDEDAYAPRLEPGAASRRTGIRNSARCCGSADPESA